MAWVDELVVAPDTTQDTTLDWLDGVVLAGTVLQIETANFDAGYKPSTGDLNATTGDIREIMFGILEHLYTRQEARSTASPTDELAGMVITKSETMVSGTDTKRTTYKYIFTRTVGDKSTFELATPVDGIGVTYNVEV